MKDRELIQDTGLFVGQKVFEFSLTESFESITNLFQTIKEYREFASPDEAAWFDYINEIFHILGFNTEKIAPRLISLQEMGGKKTSKALVCIIGPNEDFDQIIVGLDWESYLFYAAKFHQVEWVILTNGLQFKVLNYANDADKQKYFKCELDEIIKNNKTDNFFTLYKIFSVINGMSDYPTSKGQPGQKSKPKIVERNLVRKEFWSQLLSKSKGQTDLFSRNSPGIQQYLNTGTGKRGVSYNYVITTKNARLDLYIDNGDKIWNKSAFDFLAKSKSKIEESFGHSLDWDRLENKRASVIRFSMDQYGLQDKNKWPELQDQMIEMMIKFEKVFSPIVQKID